MRRGVKEQAFEEYEMDERLRLRVCNRRVEIGERVIVTDPGLSYHCPDCGTRHLRGTVLFRTTPKQDQFSGHETMLKIAAECGPEHEKEHRRFVPEWSVLVSEVVA